MEFNNKAFLYILENKDFIEKYNFELFDCENKYKIIENFENNYDIEYFQIKKTIILFCIYGYEFNNTYLYHTHKINQCVNENKCIDLTNLNIYTNSLKYFIENEKTNGILMKYIIDFVCYYLGKYSDILYVNQPENNETDITCDIDETDERMENVIELLEILNNFFELFDCRTNLNTLLN
jgi:hypothetical protein